MSPIQPFVPGVALSLSARFLCRHRRRARAPITNGCLSVEFIDLGETEFHSPDGCLGQPQALQAARGGCDSVQIYFPDTLEWGWIVCPGSCRTPGLPHPIPEAGRENPSIFHIKYEWMQSWVL